MITQHFKSTSSDWYYYLHFKCLFLFIGIFVFCNFFVTNAATIGKTLNSKPAGSSLTSGLIGYWTFDGKDLINNVADLSGQGHTGYMSNFTSTSSAVTPGEIGQALGFDGDNDLVDTGASDWINTSALTVSAWIKPRSHGEGGAGSILDNRKVIFGMYDGAGTNAVTFSSNAGVTNAKSANGSVPFNKWTHVIATRDASGVVNFYVNGTLSGTANQNSGTPASGTVGVQIGNAIYLSRTWDGYIDDLRVYNRVLSATEARQLYNQNSSYVSKTNTQINGASGGLGAGLVGHWTFDGKNMISNVADSSGQGNNGSLKNVVATSSIVVAGKLGQALSFDGTNDHVDVGSTATLDFPDASFSYSFWVYTNTVQARNVISNRATDSSSSKGYSVYFANGASSARLEMRFIDGTDHAYAISGAMKYGQWHHVAVVWNRESATVTAYTDGVQSLIPTSIVGIGSIPKSSTFKIAYGEKGYFLGSIDDVRIYNRVISVSEIMQLYNSGSTNKISSTISRPAGSSLLSGLVGHWTFDGKNMISNVADSSGQGNNGKMSGFTSTSSAVTAGKVGQGLMFDGVNDYVNCGSNSSVLSDIFSFSAWAKINNNNPAGINQIMGWSSSTAYPGLLLKFSNNRPLIYLGSNNYRYFSASSPTNVADTNWHHYVFIVTGNTLNDIDNSKLYVDGKEQDVFLTLKTGDPSTKLLCRLGMGESSTRLNGVMDDVRIYNRVLSASEVQQLYNMSK